jgi:2-keto-4-pentenoate hydratase/2-oxohepta-3-ene-1,7-dioic acid hydratase in catechol pathway
MAVSKMTHTPTPGATHDWNGNFAPGGRRSSWLCEFVVEPGDTVEVEIDRFGVLRNGVADET